MSLSNWYLTGEGLQRTGRQKASAPARPPPPQRLRSERTSNDKTGPNPKIEDAVKLIKRADRADEIKFMPGGWDGTEPAGGLKFTCFDVSSALNRPGRLVPFWEVD